MKLKKWWQSIQEAGKENEVVTATFYSLYPGEGNLRDRIPLNTNDEEAKEMTIKITNRDLWEADLAIIDGEIVSKGNENTASGWATDICFGKIEK